MTEVGIKQANDAFGKQVTAQVGRITGELNRLEQLLSSPVILVTWAETCLPKASFACLIATSVIPSPGPCTVEGRVLGL